MAKARFSRRIDTWMTEELADAIGLYAEDQGISPSAVMRQGAQLLLSRAGALRPKHNGAHSDHHEAIV